MMMRKLESMAELTSNFHSSLGQDPFWVMVLSIIQTEMKSNSTFTQKHNYPIESIGFDNNSICISNLMGLFMNAED